MSPQQQRVLKHLQEHKRITPLEAWLQLSVYRLSAVICELRNTYGYDIETKSKTHVNKYNETNKFALYVYKGVKK